MLLSKIPQHINCKGVFNIKKKDISFNFLSTNSKYIKNKSILVVNKKNNFRKKYIHEALEKGAIALITNYYFNDVNIPQLLVNNINVY